MQRTMLSVVMLLSPVVACSSSSSTASGAPTTSPEGGTTTPDGGSAATTEAGPSTPDSGADAGSCKVDTSYNPTINPADFVADVDNPFFTLEPGTTRTYEAGSERVEFTVLAERKTIMGVSCVTVHDEAKVDGKLSEDTLDWYAEDKSGAVWYFGEDTKKINPDGSVSTEGSWTAGVDGAKPGILMPGTPQVGPKFRQEYLACHAEDFGQVTEVNVSVSVRGVDYTGCIKTNDTSRIEPDLNEDKYYCKDKGLVLVVNQPDGEREELTSGP